MARDALMAANDGDMVTIRGCGFLDDWRIDDLWYAYC